mgnify:FL=1|jgi:hypothetical protein|tara:strand:+ start:1159 stop:1794 length:636 start_codon:yes stop_codon:yes gene_type:complete
MSVIKNISKLVVPAYNKGPKDVIDYINNQAWAPTSADVGLVENPGSFGSYIGTAQILGIPYLQATILATTLVIPVTTAVGTTPLKYFPASGYVQIGSEVLYYSSINRAASSVSGFDEFVVASTADRGVKGTTAAGHTAGASALFTVILFGATTKIEYNKDQAVFNIWTRTTDVSDLTGFYGDNGFTTAYITYLIPCPEDVVTFFETKGGAA